MPNLKAVTYKEILKSLAYLTEEEHLQLIRDISSRLQRKLNVKSTAPARRPKTQKALADLRGILSGVRISEKEIESAKYRPKSLPDF